MSLKGRAQETLKLLSQGYYLAPSGQKVSLQPAQATAEAQTQLYRPGELADSSGLTDCALQLVAETTQVAAQQLCQTGVRDLVLLNFASARNPGGGFLNGAKAQEEDLCRCSGLYPCLLTQPEYYQVNREQKSLLYTDHYIYSPQVPFFKTRGTGELLEEPFYSSVITAPAPNAAPLLRQDPEAGPSIAACFERRWRHVLTIAAKHGHQTLLLGAWGCGAFGNDAQVAASAFLKALKGQGHSFEKIVFAIPKKGKQSKANYLAFERVFAEHLSR